jgi:hypothetical protein
MIELHNLKSGIVGQVLKNLHSEDVKLLASNIAKVEGTSWQAAFRCRKSSPGFPKEYSLFLGIFDAFRDMPFFIELDRQQLKNKLQAWVSPTEVLSILDLLDAGDKE